MITSVLTKPDQRSGWGVMPFQIIVTTLFTRWRVSRLPDDLLPRRTYGDNRSKSR